MHMILGLSSICLQTHKFFHTFELGLVFWWGTFCWSPIASRDSASALKLGIGFSLGAYYMEHQRKPFEM